MTVMFRILASPCTSLYRFQEKCQSVDAGICRLGDDMFFVASGRGRTQGFRA